MSTTTLHGIDCNRCPPWIGISVRIQSESPSVIIGIRIIHAATTIGAQVTRMEGKIGTLKPGAFADLIVLDDDPLKDLSVFQDQGAHLAAIMKGGRFHKCRLG